MRLPTFCRHFLSRVQVDNKNNTTNSDGKNQTPKLRVDNESGKEIENEDDIL